LITWSPGLSQQCENGHDVLYPCSQYPHCPFEQSQIFDAFSQSFNHELRDPEPLFYILVRLYLQLNRLRHRHGHILTHLREEVHCWNTPKTAAYPPIIMRNYSASVFRTCLSTRRHYLKCNKSCKRLQSGPIGVSVEVVSASAFREFPK
jgi:hypothetical protein